VSRYDHTGDGAEASDTDSDKEGGGYASSLGALTPRALPADWRRPFHSAVRASYHYVRGESQVRFLGDASSSLGDAKSSLGDAESSLGDANSSLGDATSSLGDAKSSLGDAKSSLGYAKSSLGDTKSSLGDATSSRANQPSLL
jgi:hypothetical protein